MKRYAIIALALVLGCALFTGCRRNDHRETVPATGPAATMPATRPATEPATESSTRPMTEPATESSSRPTGEADTGSGTEGSTHDGGASEGTRNVRPGMGR